MEELRDIKGLMVIEEYSLYIFLTLVLAVIFLIILLMKWVLKYVKQVSPLKKAKQNLKNLDFNNAKDTAYKVSKYVPFLRVEEDLSYLEKYKYKKENIEFLREDREKLKIFLEKQNV